MMSLLQISLRIIVALLEVLHFILEFLLFYSYYFYFECASYQSQNKKEKEKSIKVKEKSYHSVEP